MKILTRQNLLRYVLLGVGIFCVMVASGDSVPGATFGQWLTMLLALVTTAAACFYGIYRIDKTEKRKTN